MSLFQVTAVNFTLCLYVFAYTMPNVRNNHKSHHYYINRTGLRSSKPFKQETRGRLTYTKKLSKSNNINFSTPIQLHFCLKSLLLNFLTPFIVFCNLVVPRDRLHVFSNPEVKWQTDQS